MVHVRGSRQGHGPSVHIMSGRPRCMHPGVFPRPEQLGGPQDCRQRTSNRHSDERAMVRVLRHQLSSSESTRAKRGSL
jgi:hypothetical protein